jgi:hypothetical protein
MRFFQTFKPAQYRRAIHTEKITYVLNSDFERFRSSERPLEPQIKSNGETCTTTTVCLLNPRERDGPPQIHRGRIRHTVDYFRYGFVRIQALPEGDKVIFAFHNFVNLRQEYIRRGSQSRHQFNAFLRLGGMLQLKLKPYPLCDTLAVPMSELRCAIIQILEDLHTARDMKQPWHRR